MATLVLGAVGSALGGAVGGPIGAVLGKAAGSFLGNTLDHHLFGQDSHVEGRRLTNLDVQTSTEGAGMPLTFGRVRLTGQVIWATRFEEVATTTKHKTGGKGGGPSTTSTTYSYFANFAIGLCEGRIAGISRVWADGKPLDLNTVTLRTYRGTEDQPVDPLIAAKEGEAGGQAPAFRGTAYVVFERLALEPFGNRLPQLSFEVIRPVGGLEEKIRAITVIPGSTEFGYDPEPVVRLLGPGVTEPENTHDTSAPTDWHAALDQLQALCPNLERVALVVAWFGTSLAAGDCRIEPRVDHTDKQTSKDWQVAGLTRETANQVSTHAGRPAYGGAPSDESVIAAIQDLRARGLKVTLLPFIMMDVPADNQLTDPWTGATSQPAYPWRGRITIAPAPGQPGSPDRTPAAAAQIAQFVGSPSPGTDEWSFRRFILHYAHLAAAAGGVDAFIMGSELRGLTFSRDAPGSHPFVDALVTLAGEVRTILGPGPILTYGADWSEYSKHVPSDGSGDLTFHLDPLWASPAIDVIGIDQYQPLTDWRHAAVHRDQALGASPYDPAVIKAGISGGENFDWYYASWADRVTQTRTPISDGDYGEPWVWRSKDMVSWWENPHHNRVGGVRQPTSTAYQPAAKPIWLAELGAPAVDLAGNEPSAFPSDKPDNDRLPHFALGTRDDAQQRALLEACLDVWSDEGSTANPLSPVDGRAMIDPSGTHLWTWDARPYPAFPLAQDVWSDGVNWTRGHWLNGRLGAVTLAAILTDLVRHFDLPPMDVSRLYQVVEGFWLDGPSDARAPLDDLATLYAFDLAPTPGGARALPRGRTPTRTVPADRLVDTGQEPLLTFVRGDREALPRQMTLGFASSQHDYQPGIMRSARCDGSPGPDRFRSVSITLDPDTGGQMAERIAQEHQIAAQTLALKLPPSLRHMEPGDTLAITPSRSALPEGAAPLHICLERCVDGKDRAVEAHCVDPALYGVAPVRTTTAPSGAGVATRPVFGAPDILVLDLPASIGQAGAAHNVQVAALAHPWPGSVDLFEGLPESGSRFVQALGRPATIGTLETALPAGPVAFPHRGGTVRVAVPTGSLETVSEPAFLTGANLAVILSQSGLEVTQFQETTLITSGLYELSGLLRGLGGTEDQALSPTPAGARLVLLDAAVEPLELSADTLMRGVTLHAEPRGGGVGALARRTLDVMAAPRSLVPLAPVHVRADAAPDGALHVQWVRRARGVSDDWSLPSVPLNEERERYRVRVRIDGSAVRAVEVASPGWTYTPAMQAADGVNDLPAGTPVTLAIAQLGTAGRVGSEARIAL